MAILSFTVHIQSAATLLLFAVRFMRLGIERLWSREIRMTLGDGSSSFALLWKGTGIGFALQGATGVVLLTAGLVGSGVIPAISAAIVILGADLGSAIAVLFLSLPISALSPVYVLIGGSLYLRSLHPKTRNVGRVILGLGLILLSLNLIRATVAPLGSLPELQSAVQYLAGDPVTAATLGVVLTIVMHSGVAAILTVAAYAMTGHLGPVPAVGFVLGCNIGSALLPLVLLRGGSSNESAAPKTVALLRIPLALVFITWLAATGSEGIPDVGSLRAA